MDGDGATGGEVQTIGLRENSDPREMPASRETYVGDEVEEAPAHLSAEPICPGWSETTASTGGAELVFGVVFGCGDKQRERKRGRVRETRGERGE